MHLTLLRSRGNAEPEQHHQKQAPEVTRQGERLNRRLARREPHGW